MADLTQDQWQEQLSNDADAVILDVRTDEELEEGFIPNAVHIDIYQGQEFINQVEALDKDKTYYVYCRSGNRSGQACAIMNQLGFEKTNNLLGGFSEWEGAIANN
ncbi:rhodanese-like domain-containing protein [Corallibacter sp.]|uniref:rhodanese-like domain-containing protein n=1 Tax=Corallibacter sp. TaxID=2038084 RepID=UPI003A8F139C